MYFGKPKDSSANVPRFPGAASICASAATREHLVSMTDYGANLIWELIYFSLPTREGTKVYFFAFGHPREFQNNVRFQRARIVRHSTHAF